MNKNIKLCKIMFTNIYLFVIVIIANKYFVKSYQLNKIERRNKNGGT